MKNLRTFIYMLTLLLSAVGIQPAQAQAEQDALYIYRNDGKFNAFFFGDIERFEYSRIDTLGVEHEDYVVQDVYALDTLFRIPLSAIDSIGFVTPETVFKKDVAHTTESDLWNYVTASDSATMIRLASNTPKGLIPKVGDKIVTVKSREFLPGGFYGLVKSVDDKSDGIIVKCEVPPFTDLFDQWVCKAAAIGQPVEDGSRQIVRRSEKPYEVEIPLSPVVTFKWGLDDGDISYAINDNWSLKGHGYVSGGVSKKINLRAFMAIRWELGINFDVVQRVETTTWFDLEMYGEVGGQIDFHSPYLNGYHWIPDTPFAVEWEGGYSLSASGSVEAKVHRKHVTSAYQMVQFNDSFYDDEYSQCSETFHTLASEAETSLTGTVSATAGPYLSVCVSLAKKEIGKIGLRFDAGLKFETSAKMDMPDYLLVAAPANMPDFMRLLPTALYDQLNVDGSIKFGRFFKCDFEAQLANLKKLKYSKTLYDNYSKVDTKKWVDFEGGLVPKFSNTKLDYNEAENTLKAAAALTRKTMFGNNVGFAIYYSKSGKRKARELYDKLYYVTSNEEASFHKWEQTFDAPGGGKELKIFPIVRLNPLNYEILASPYVTYTIPPKLKAAPEKLEFDANGGELSLTVTDNLDRNEDKYTDEYGVTIGEDEEDAWLSVKKEGDAYKVTAKPNATTEERTGTVDFHVYNKDRDIDLVLNVPVTQKAPELMFSVSPENAEVPGYSKEFKDGELTKLITVVYPKTATDIKMSSSAESWLTVDKNWVSSTSDDMNTTGVKTVHIKPNFSLETPREGVITVEMTDADGSVAKGTMTVKQSAFDLKLEVNPTDLILTAEEKKNAAYSHKATVKIQMDPTDSYVRAAIKKVDVKASEDWIDATLKDDVIEVRAKANPKEEERTGTITYTVEMKDGGTMSKNINVRQLEKQVIMAFTFSPEKVRFPVKGGDKQVFVVGNDVERILTIDCKDSEWLGGNASGLSITLVAKESEEEQERVTPVFITAKMKDGTTETEYFLVYQDGTKTNTTAPDPDAIKKIYFYAYNKAHSDQDNWDNLDDEEWHWKVSSVEMYTLFTKDNSTFKGTVNGDNLHVECSGSESGYFGSSMSATLSFDVINYNSSDASKAKITNVKYSSNLRYYAGEEGFVNMRQSVNVANIPVWNLEPVYIASAGTVADGVEFSNFSDVTQAADGTMNCYYDHDPGNKALLRISFEGNEDDSWSDVIEDDDDDDWGDDDDDWSRSTEKQARQKRVHSALERRLLQQVKKIKKQ